MPIFAPFPMPRRILETLKLTVLFRKFYAISRSGGGILVLCTLFSLILANGDFAENYKAFWEYKFGYPSTHFHLFHSVTEWINDGLMTLFFLLVGLEIEREMLIGELSDRKNAMLPIVAAVGGMIVPALFYGLVNISAIDKLSGMGIPTATDIAFALAVIGMLGKQVPNALKVFLVALAIMDDLGAIAVIALFYGGGIAWVYLFAVLVLFGALLILKKKGVTSLWIYIPAGFLLWFFMLHSGIHATLSGVLLAFAIPLHSGIHKSPSYRLEQALQAPVSWVIVPLFALANTALTLNVESFANVTGTIGMGIFLGLVVGKPLGIYLASMLAIKFNIAAMPANTSKKMLLGAGMLGGIGFTMAIFVANLAFESQANIEISKLAILISSVSAALLGLAFLRFSIKSAIKS